MDSQRGTNPAATATGKKGLGLRSAARCAFAWRAAAAAALVVVLAPTVSEAGTTQVNFLHTAPSEVAEFRVWLGFAPGVYLQSQSVGIPQQDGAIYQANVDIPEGIDIYLAIVAVGHNGLMSTPSNSRLRHIAGGPAPPAPPPSSGLGAPGRPVLEFD